MRLLIVTQAVDRADPVLGFMHRWIKALAARFESIVVICLREGEHSLPVNVRVYSLGKEKGSRPAFMYAIRFKALAWKLRHEYDAAFVHMNQEYILIAGPLWKLLGKKIYMWRNHYAGSWLTDVAAAFCTKVFCTSKSSYTAKYQKTVFMPAGVDTETFHTDAAIPRLPRSILFLARMSPSKHPDVLIDALAGLKQKGIAFSASLYGDPLPHDERYYASLKEKVASLGLADSVAFEKGVPNGETPAVYRAHEIFVNCSKSGMFDKTLFEAAACGSLVVASSKDLKELAGEDFSFEQGDAGSLAARLESLLAVSPPERAELSERLQEAATKNSLASLVAKISDEVR